MTQRHTLLGALFLTVVGLLGYFTLFQADMTLFSEKQSFKAYFNNTNGLRVGDPVLVAGMRWGKVDALTFDPSAQADRRIEVAFSLTEEVMLREDARITIEDSTLLGGKNLSVEPGVASAPWREGEAILGDVGGNVLESVERLVEENRAAIKRAVDGIDAIVLQLRSTEGTIGALINDPEMRGTFSDALTELRNTFSNLDELTQGLKEGKGTLGKFFQDDSLYTRIEEIAAQLEDVSSKAGTFLDKAQDPESGLIGRITADPEVGRDAKDLIASLKTVAADMEAEQGLWNLLLRDEEFSQRVDKIVTQLAEGEGTLGKLVMSDEAYQKLDSILEEANTFMVGLNDTEHGTVARLVHDTALYEELERAVRTLTGTLEEAREAAPISTFLTTVFLGF